MFSKKDKENYYKFLANLYPYGIINDNFEL